MHTPQVTLPNRITAQKWCTGPYWKQWGVETSYGHSGTNSGGSSMLLWIPGKNLAIATIANVLNQGYPLADRIFDTVFPDVRDWQAEKSHAGDGDAGQGRPGSLSWADSRRGARRSNSPRRAGG
jgi:hypothetical protein